MKAYRLYGTSACHLCELAEEMILATRPGGGEFALEKVDIAESDELFERYGVLIPVLADTAGRELRWPFTAVDLEKFFAQAPT